MPEIETSAFSLTKHEFNNVFDRVAENQMRDDVEKNFTPAVGGSSKKPEGSIPGF